MKLHRYDPRDDLVPIDVDAAHARARDLLASKRANPDAVPFTLEQCEDHVDRLEALQARQERGLNAAVARLLASPVDVLADREQWPSAADLADGTDQLAAAYRRWILAGAEDAGGSWAAAVRALSVQGAADQDDHHARALHWLLRHAKVPFPVGKACLAVRDGFPAAAARALMPFDDDAHAALVLTVPVADRRVTVFSLARRKPYEVLLNGEWLPDSPHWVIDGTDVRTDPPRPRGFSDTRGAAKRWWKSLAGLRIEPGHPKGQRDRAPRAVIDALVAYKTEHGSIPPTLEQFLDHALTDREGSARRTTWRRLSRDWGLSWPELCHAVYGDRRRTRHYVNRG